MEGKELAVAIDATAPEKFLERARTRVAELLEPYGDISPEALAGIDDKQVKACYTDLNKAIKEIDDGRKEVTRPVKEALKRFEAEAKELCAGLTEAREVVKAERDAREEARVSARLALLDETYNDFAPVLYDVVPLERLMDGEKWTNASIGDVKACELLTEKAAHVGAEYNALMSHALKCPDETVARYVETLNLAGALRFDTEHAEQLARLAEMRAQVEANRAAYERELRFEEVEPEPVEQTEPEPPAEPAEYVAQTELEPSQVFAICAECTRSQLDGILASMRAEGIRGTATACAADSVEAAWPSVRAAAKGCANGL